MQNGLMVKADGSFARRTVGVLVARQNGKSHLMRMRLLWGLFVNDETWLSMAQNRSLALEQFQQAVAVVDSFDWLRKKVKRVSRTNGKEYLELMNGCKWSVVASTKEGARGYTGNLWVDELRDVTPEAWKAATPVTRAVRNAQTWITSNAGDAHSVVLNDLRSMAIHANHPSVGWYEWSADPNYGVLDKRGWYQANPAIGHLIDEDVIAQAAATDKPEAFRTESLCLWVESLTSPWASGAVEACTVSEQLIDPAREVVWAIDVTPDRRRADLVVGQVLEDGRIGFAIVQTWVNDFSIDDMAIASDVAEYFRKYQSQLVAFDKWTGASIAQKLVSARIPVQDISGALFAQACDETLSAMNSGRLAHNGSQELIDHFNSCAKKETDNGGWRVVRRGSNTYISAAVASIMVTHLLSKPEPASEFYVF